MIQSQKKKIGVLGAGTWGMALARVLVLNGHEVTVWSAVEEEIDIMLQTGKHKNLPEMVIPEEIVFTKEIETACREKDIIVMAVASPYVRATAAKIRPYIAEDQIIVNVAKGIESSTLLTLTEVIEDELKKEGGFASVCLGALSGPTHAEEVSKDMPSAIVSACADLEVAKTVQDAFMNPMFRVYTNTDIKGVELCGSMKNVIALATGISDGVGYGDNLKAALITRGITEITRLGAAMGCNEQTFSGLTGVGDLIVTATSPHSRNNRAGHLLGEGYSVEETLQKVGMVVEGLNALPAAMKIAEKYGVEIPITEAVDSIVNKGVEPKEAVRRLMERERKAE